MSADPCGCGCCQAPVPAAPVQVENPPGLPAVKYRIGTYPTFREALVEQLDDSLALRALSTRDPSDYALAVLDSWAYLADILTFYSERTINEAFLRTAQLRDSVVRLSAMVGYDPSPGLAATAPLAFVAQAAQPFTLPAGARVQSAPQPRDSAPPVKFETLSELTLSAALNSVSLLPPPEPAAPLGAGSSAGLLEPGSSCPPGLAVGATLIAWSASGGQVERKRVLALNDDQPAGGLRWTPPLEAAAEHLSVAVKTVRPFGYDTPSSFIASTLAPPSPSEPAPTVQLTQVSAGATQYGPHGEEIPYEFELDGQKILYDYRLPSSSTIALDAIYTDLEVGDRLLIPDPGASPAETVCATITAVATVAARFGSSQATVTQVTLDTPTPPIADRREATLIVLGEDIPLWEFALPANIAGASVYAMLSLPQAPLDGQAVVLTDATGAAHETAIVACAPAPELPGALAITLAPALGGPLDTATATMLGNLVRSSQGETVTGELLGSGDATIAGQRFPLGKPPITYVPYPGAPHGGQSTLVVRVGGVQWSEREHLYGAGGEDRVFVVEREDDGSYYVCFGDGVIGSRLPSGAQVTADYRTGLGSAGNVAAGALRLALTRPTGLVSVSNPLAAGGGADPETLAEARANAPNTVRTFERIVSLQDVEDQARQNALVAKASAAWIMLGVELGVGLTVAGPAGEALGAEQLAELQADLDARRDPNRPLEVHGYTPVALSIAVRLLAIAADLRAEDVSAAVQAALLAHFAFAARQFGQPVRLSEVFVAAQNTPGVLGVEVEALTLAEPAQRAAHMLSAAAVQQRIDLFPAELATLTAADLTVTLP